MSKLTSPSGHEYPFVLRVRQDALRPQMADPQKYGPFYTIVVQYAKPRTRMWGFTTAEGMNRFKHDYAEAIIS